MPFAVVGREQELGALDALLDAHAATPGPTAVALEGDAGIGKSTLWGVAVEAAEARGLRVLTARAAESERAFAHAALGDLLDDVLPEVLPALTPPQRHALEVALLISGDDAAAPVDPRALGVAMRSTLRSLAEGGSYSRSTTSSGSTRRRRARSRSPCAGCRRVACC